MNKVGIITFHAPHNYGANLQAFALQKTVKSLGYDVEIIDFRTAYQKDIYNVFTKRTGIKYILKNIFCLLTYKSRKAKYNKFESFIGALNRTKKEYATLEELYELKDVYYACISGSDQIWNVLMSDFDQAYMLPFCGKQTKRIAYAPSCGNSGDVNKITSDEASYLREYDNIAVRDDATADVCAAIVGKRPNVVLDPTLLIDIDEYRKIMSPKRLIEGDYIFLYTLDNNEEMVKIGKYMSKKFHMPVYISNISGLHFIFNFKKKTDSGPLDFLNLIEGAKYVLASSYHALIFSLLFKKQFWTFGADKDNRKKQLLAKFGFSDRNISLNELEKLDDIIIEKRYAEFDLLLRKERDISIEYLTKALGDEI